MRVAHTLARWSVCFLALPALWIAASFGAGLQAVMTIPAAVVVALLSALTAYRSGRGRRGALGYFLGTIVMIGVLFAIAIAIFFTIYCSDGSSVGVC